MVKSIFILFLLFVSSFVNAYDYDADTRKLVDNHRKKSAEISLARDTLCGIAHIYHYGNDGIRDRKKSEEIYILLRGNLGKEYCYESQIQPKERKIIFKTASSKYENYIQSKDNAIDLYKKNMKDLAYYRDEISRIAKEFERIDTIKSLEKADILYREVLNHTTLTSKSVNINDRIRYLKRERTKKINRSNDSKVLYKKAVASYGEGKKQKIDHQHGNRSHSHVFPLNKGVRHAHNGGVLGGYENKNISDVDIVKKNTKEELKYLIGKSKKKLSKHDYIKTMQRIADIYENSLDIKHNYQYAGIYHNKVWKKYKNKESYLKLGILLYEKKTRSSILNGSSILNKLSELKYQPAIDYMNIKETGKIKINTSELYSEYKKIEKNNWKSIDKFLKKYGYGKSKEIDDVYRFLFLLKNKKALPRTEKEFEADLMNYSKDYSGFIKVSVLDERATNQTTIDTLPNTPININLRKNDVLITLKISAKEDSPYKIKHNHRIKIKATLIVKKDVSGFVGMFYEPDYDAYDIFFTMPLKKGKKNPQKLKYGVTSGVGFPLFESTLGFKSTVKYSFKYKIVGVEE